MTMSTAIRDMTFKGEPTQNIRRQAQMMGMRTLVDDALDKALIGVTTLQEVLMLHRGGH
jgi:type IV pilus assembly protein PilB